MLSILATHDIDGYVPGINNLLEGGYQTPEGTIALSAQEKIERGQKAIAALDAFRKAQKEGNKEAASVARRTLDENVAYFGYGYIKDPAHLVPPVGLTFWSFRIMVGLGGYFILFFIGGTCPVSERQTERCRVVTETCTLDYPVGVYCRTSRLGGSRSRSSAVGYSGYVAGGSRYFQVADELRADNFLYFPDIVYYYADC